MEWRRSGPYFGPFFGPDNQVLYVLRDGTANYLTRMKKDGSDLSRMLPVPISGIYGGGFSDRRWIIVSLPASDDGTGTIVAVPTAGGLPRRICEGFRPVSWAPDGKYFYIGLARNNCTHPGKTLAIPLRPGESLPNLPTSGTRALTPADFPESRLIDAWFISPGPDPSVFAYVKTTVHRNLYRIPVLN